MTTTVKLAPGQTAAVSSTISVASGDIKVISIYAGTDVPIPAGVDMKLQRQNAVGNWQDVYAPELGHVVLQPTLLNVVVSGIGEYRVVRPNISVYGVNVGVSEDS